MTKPYLARGEDAILMQASDGAAAGYMYDICEYLMTFL